MIGTEAVFVATITGAFFLGRLCFRMSHVKWRTAMSAITLLCVVVGCFTFIAAVSLPFVN